MFKVNIFLAAGLAVLLGGCASAPTDIDAEASAAAQAALNAMQGGESAALPSALNAPNGEPAWISSPYNVYDKNAYVAAVGSGGNRAAAERGAFAALTAVFGQSVEAEFSNLTNYSEAIHNGSIAVSENNAVREAVKTSSAMDSLIGAEITGVWQNSADKYWYAVAVLDKKKASSLYSELIRGNIRLIDEITTIPDTESNSLEAFSRYQLAATIAGANELYGNLLSVIAGGTPAAANLPQIRNSAYYHLEAAKIARGIPIAVKVTGDMQNRIGNAFAVSLGRIGFKSGGNNNRYILSAEVSLTDANLSGNQFQFCRYNVDAYLIDTANGGRLAPYNISGREGHTAMSEAELRAVNAAVKKIDAEYENVFDNFFSSNLLRQ
ncbi:MAG: LPP20 family lipoprotein [Spirochaetaceae bacterium]|jgi:hypothetical protein|nr:LPP20 family lipoprotein [Spirochaetaceae bacterium]